MLGSWRTDSNNFNIENKKKGTSSKNVCFFYQIFEEQEKKTDTLRENMKKYMEWNGWSRTWKKKMLGYRKKIQYDEQRNEEKKEEKNPGEHWK